VVVSDPKQANGTSLADSLVSANRLGPDDDLLHPEQRVNPLLWRTSVCTHGVPPWLVEELSGKSDRPDHLIESIEQAERRCASGVVSTAPDMPGALTGDSVPIPRVPEDGMSPSDFFHRHVRTGLPLVLAGTAGNITGSREKLRIDIRAARAARLTDRTQSKESEMGCNMDGCRRVHLCGDGCEEAGRMREELVPAVFNFRGDNTTAQAFSWPEVFSGKTGQQFGGPTHFDASCDGSISLQLDGRKTWTLWSPWPIDVTEAAGTPFGPRYQPRRYPAHTRFEAVLEEGDSLFFAPGFFHATNIEQGPSIAAVYFFTQPPMYGAVAGEHLGHPLGFESCLFAQKNSQWRELLAGRGRREDGTPLERDRS